MGFIYDSSRMGVDEFTFSVNEQEGNCSNNRLVFIYTVNMQFWYDVSLFSSFWKKTFSCPFSVLFHPLLSTQNHCKDCLNSVYIITSSYFVWKTLCNILYVFCTNLTTSYNHLKRFCSTADSKLEHQRSRSQSSSTNHRVDNSTKHCPVKFNTNKSISYQQRLLLWLLKVTFLFIRAFS